MKDINFKFPENFFWGSASASHQVEGNNSKNQWWEYEQQNNSIKNGHKSGIACDHYNRYEEDFMMLKDLNHNAHRLSFEWSRFFPNSPNEINWKAVKHYHMVLNKLLELKLEPFVTTFHFTIPLWFSKIGGFREFENIKYYEQFVKLLVKEYKNKIKYWNTINEPGTYIVFSCFIKNPKNIFYSFKMLRNLIIAHAKCYHIIKNEIPDAQVGLVKHVPYLVPKKVNNFFDKIGSSVINKIFNDIIIEALKTGRINFPIGKLFEKHEFIKNSSDFIGLNYFMKMFFALKDIKNHISNIKVRNINKIDFEIFPEGIYKCIMKYYEKLNIPIYITENGTATDNDDFRIEYIKSHIKEIHKAIKDGADVKGYFYWSNLDNFEWIRGFEPKFGLISVDRKNNLQRTLKKSAIVYSNIISNNGF